MILFLCMYALLTVALVFSLVFIMRHARSSNNDATKKIVPIMAVAVVAVASYTAFLASDGYYVAMFFNTVYYICTIWMTFFLLRFSYSYVGMPGKLPFERVLAVLGVVDSLSLLVNLFTYHSYDLVMMVYSLYHQYWGLAFTPLHYVHLGFCYVMVASSFVLLLVGAVRAPSFYKQKFLFILGGYLLVIVANFISYTFNAPVDFSVLLYAVMAGFICFYTAYTFPHQLVTYLLDNVNEKIEDGLVFFDEHGGYVYSNERARRLLSDGAGGFSPSAAEEYAKAWKSVHPEEEKNGRDGGMAHSLGERIFAHKCALIRLLQGGAWAAPEYADFRSRLVGEVREQLDALNLELTAVRLVKRQVVRFRQERAFDCLTEADVHELAEQVAPLVFNGDADGYAKSFDSFCPLGPAAVTGIDPEHLHIQTRLNGKVMQDSTTDMLIFGIRRLVSFISHNMTLLPGTVILTGTPEGVGFKRNPPVFLQEGDIIEIDVENIGILTNKVRNEE